VISKICRSFQKKLAKLVEFTFFPKNSKISQLFFWDQKRRKFDPKITLMLTHKRLIPFLKQGWLSYLARRLFSWLEIRVCFQLFDNKKFGEFFQKFSKLVRFTLGEKNSISLSENDKFCPKKITAGQSQGFFFKFLKCLHWRGSPALISIKWQLS
jgi:hypothetical protein